MDKYGVWSTFEAQPGKAEEVEVFLAECCAWIERENGTTTFFAAEISPGCYATFDAFKDKTALDMHVNGSTAKVVRARSAELFTAPPVIVKVKIITAKLR